MRIKSFFAETIDAAMKAAHLELGPDALVVTSRRSSPQAAHLGKYEVVAGVIDEGAPKAEAAAAPPAPPRRAQPLAAQFAELRKQVEGLREFLGSAELPPLETLDAWPPEAEFCFNQLLSKEVDAALAREVVEAAVENAGSGSFRAAASAALGEKILVDDSLEGGADQLRVLALVGPPGAGKTSMILKLAVRYGLLKRRPVHLVCADSVRVGAAALLQTYASLLGVRCHHFPNTAALSAGLAKFRAPELVLVDTPGLSRPGLEFCRDLIEALRRLPALETSLVLPASMRRADLRAAIKLYDAFQPKHWILTKMDETSAYGCAVGEAIAAGRRISFLSFGQQIPEDLEAASAERLAALLIPGEMRRAAHVA